MDKFFRRMLSKKGFTMVELLVVIAIIGILAAMVIPNLLTSDVPTKGKAYAKAYYFAGQEFFSRMKVADDISSPSNQFLDPTLGDSYFYTTVNSHGDVVESGIVGYDGSGVPDSMTNSTTFATSAALAPRKQIVKEFAEYMSKNLAECDYEGTYYLVVDKYYRVQVAYWSDATISELRSVSSTLSYIDDNNVGGYWSCAFPVEMSTASGVADRRMFDYNY